MRLQIKSGQYTVYYMQYRNIAFQTQPKITKSKMNSQIKKAEESAHQKSWRAVLCSEGLLLYTQVLIISCNSDLFSSFPSVCEISIVGMCSELFSCSSLCWDAAVGNGPQGTQPGGIGTCAHL